jgi:hypothetical protein
MKTIIKAHHIKAFPQTLAWKRAVAQLRKEGWKIVKTYLDHDEHWVLIENSK